MTWIRIEPAELTGMAERLRAVAAETSVIGTELSRCVHCTMPADVEVIVNQIVGMADALLDEMARRLAASADDLLTRAGVAANDSLAAASAAPTGASFGGGFVVGGGGSYGTPIDSPFGGGFVVGGGGSYGTPIDSPFGGGSGGGVVVGGGGAYGTPQPPVLSTGGAGGIFGVDEASFRPTTMQGGLFLGSAPSATATSMGALPVSVSGPNWNPPVANDPRLQAVFFGLGQSNHGQILSSVATSRADYAQIVGRPVPIEEFNRLGTGGFTGRVDPPNLLPVLLAGLR